MNLKQLIEEVNKDIDDSLSSGDVLGWINRGLDDLTPVTRKESMKITEVVPENIYTLPEDLFEIAFIRANGVEYSHIPFNDTANQGYKLWGNTMYFQPGLKDGSIEMFYFKRLTHLQNEDDVPEIDPSYHDLIVLYAIAHSQYADEEPERQIDALNRYLARKREYGAHLLSRSNTTYQVKLIQ